MRGNSEGIGLLESVCSVDSEWFYEVLHAVLDSESNETLSPEMISRVEFDAFVRDMLEAFKWNISSRDHYFVKVTQTLELAAAMSGDSEFANKLRDDLTEFFKNHKAVEDDYIKILEGKWNPNNKLFGGFPLRL